MLVPVSLVRGRPSEPHWIDRTLTNSASFYGRMALSSYRSFHFMSDTSDIRCIVNQSLLHIMDVQHFVSISFLSNGQTTHLRSYWLCVHTSIQRWGNPNVASTRLMVHPPFKVPEHNGKRTTASLKTCGSRNFAFTISHLFSGQYLLLRTGGQHTIYLFQVMLVSKSSIFVTCRGFSIRQQSPKSKTSLLSCLWRFFTTVSVAT
jgi:hypothetical protein